MSELTKINAGEFDHLITLRKCTMSTGASGAKKYVLTDYAKVWAKIERDVSENISDLNLEQGNVIVATLYKTKDLTSRWQVVVEGTSYEIQQIDALERMSPFTRLTLHSITK